MTLIVHVDYKHVMRPEWPAVLYVQTWVAVSRRWRINQTEWSLLRWLDDQLFHRA